MPKQMPYLNEIISLFVMLLMLAAFISGQADGAQRLVDRGDGADRQLIRADDEPDLRF